MTLNKNKVGLLQMKLIKYAYCFSNSVITSRID